MGEKQEKRQTSKITNKALKRVKRGILTASTIFFVGGALVGTAFSNNAKSIKESVMEHFRNKQKTATTISIDEGEKTTPVVKTPGIDIKEEIITITPEAATNGTIRPTTIKSPVKDDTSKSPVVDALQGFNPKNTLVLGVNFPTVDSGLNTKKNSNALSIDDKIKQDFEVTTLQSTEIKSTAIQKNKSLAISFGAGSMMYVAGDNINLDIALGVAFRTKLSDHSAFFADLLLATGSSITVNGNTTLSDLVHNPTFMAKVGVTFTWGGEPVVQVAPDVYAVLGAVKHKTPSKNNGGSSSGGQDKPSEEGSIDYDTTLPNNGNDSLGTDGDVIFIDNSNNTFPGNDSFGDEQQFGQ